MASSRTWSRAGAVRGPGRGIWKKRAEGGVVAELVTEAAKRSGGVAKLAGHHGGRLVIQEVSAKGLVLALASDFGAPEELGGLGVRKGIVGTDNHNEDMLGKGPAAGKQLHTS